MTTGSVKSAEENESKVQRKGRNARKMGLGFMGALGAAAGSFGLGSVAKHYANNPVEGDTATMEKMRARAHVPVHDAPDLDNSFFIGRQRDAEQARAQLPIPSIRGIDDAKGAVVLGGKMKSPSILAHELGHADLHHSRLGRVLQNPTTIRAGSAAPLVGQLAGLATGALSDNPNVHAAGLAAPLLASAPELIYEAGATLKGIRHMRNAGASGRQLAHFAKTLAPAWGTYASRAGLGVANSAFNQGLGNMARQGVKNMMEEPKEAFAVSEYAGPMGPVKFQQASQLPPFHAPSLAKPVEKPKQKVAGGLTPAGRLVSTQQTGTGFGKSPSGPSIASIAKPPGVGQPLPGAQKNQI